MSGLIDGLVNDVVEKFDDKFEELMQEIAGIDSRLADIEKKLDKLSKKK